jgi:arylsulfatase A-like enzyme
MSKHNVLLFLTDEQRQEGVGCYGGSPVRTPNVDALAKHGTRFRNAYCTTPLCSPSRASIITGLYPHAHGINSNIHEMGAHLNELPDHPQLLPRLFESAGYATGYNGKWHLGSEFTHVHQVAPWFKLPNTPVMPSDRGFSHSLDFPGHGDGGAYYPQFQDYLKSIGHTYRVKRHTTDGEKITGFGVLDGPVEATVSYFLAERTIGLIDQMLDSGKPFFMWHNEWGPHGAHLVPQEYLDRYKNVEIEPWGNFDWTPPPHHPCRVELVPQAEQFRWDDWAEVLRYYYAFCTLIDDQFGRIVQHLHERGVFDQTQIIFASDHGENLGSHGGLTNKGFSHFEEIQQVPLIIHGPGVKSGQVREELTSLLDILPTACDMAGVDYDADRAHGRSLRPMLEDGDDVDWRESVFVEFFGLANLATNMITCRHGDWKYGWTCSGQDELYHLADDPDELHNLIDETKHAGALRELRRRTYYFMLESKYPGAGSFARTRLGYNVDRQYLDSPDPQPVEDLPLATAW